jgi:hypothetical protein
VKIRPSVGIGFRNDGKDDLFIGIAIPVDESGMTPVFMVSCRFSGF